MKKVAIILGSSRPSRISPQIGKWAQEILNSSKVKYDIIDLKKVNLPFLDEFKMPISGNYDQEHTIKWSNVIKSYDGIILLFPQYNSGVPAILKNAIDYLGKEWINKPVSCITYGFHGGTLGYAAMLMSMNTLKMNRLAVNPTISITKEMFDEKNHFKDIKTALKDYKNDISLLKINFENILGC